MTPRFAVFGHPVAHSRSPQIHAVFAAQAGITMRYERIDAAPAAFADAVHAFGHAGGRGANVTLPHKPAAMGLCEALSPRALRAGAVNTLVRMPGDAPRWQGDNTDGIGLVRDLVDRHGLVLRGARVLLLGAGGAGAGVAPALLDAGVDTLAVFNRTVQRAHELAAHLGDARISVIDAERVDAMHAHESRRTTSGAHHRLDDFAFDLVVNATSAARSDQAPWSAFDLVLAKARVAVDLGYGDAARPFLEFARERGVARRIDGLGMLVEQAAESFRLWHGVMPDTAPAFATLRAELGDPP